MTRSIDLFELQEADLAAAVAEQRLAEISLEMETDPDVSELESRLADLELQLQQARVEQHAADETVEDLRAATRSLEQKLYSGSVKIPKELKSLQDDTLSHQKQLAAAEDRSLAALASVEQVATALAGAREERAAQVQGRHEQLERLTTEQEELTALVARLQSERARRAERIDRSDLALYERLRRARGGRAVAKVERGTCQGCRIGLPTTIFQRARSGLKIVQCTSCERILYVV